MLSVSLLERLPVGLHCLGAPENAYIRCAPERDSVWLQASPLNPGLILFMFLCTACVFVWTRLAILCCTLRRVSKFLLRLTLKPNMLYIWGKSLARRNGGFSTFPSLLAWML